MTNTIMIRCDNPEKNKIGVYKYIKRKVYNQETMPYIKYNNHEYYVLWRGNDENGDYYELFQIKNL